MIRRPARPFAPRPAPTDVGRAAESLCALRLRLKGYRILARNFRTPQGEIDLVAKRGRVLAFVEVKRRDTLDQALNALQARQRRRIVRAAEAFLAVRPTLAGLDLRFDVMTVVPGRWPRHIMDAWRLP